MNNRKHPAILLLAFLFVLSASSLPGQEIRIGFLDSIESKVLKESRKLIIKLPKDYYSSDKSYPVLLRLDGDEDLFIETAGVVQRLAYREELIPEMILVMIQNTHRTRDMMPVNTNFYKEEPGAEKFKTFIEDELFLHLNSFYRTSGERILCGQSLSSIFTLYCFLTSPDSFNSYIASSAGFPDCEAYFVGLTTEMLKTSQNKLKKVFLSYGGEDFLDPEGVMEKQVSDFTQEIQSDDHIECFYKKYSEEGHVPFQSLYHGLKYIYQ